MYTVDITTHYRYDLKTSDGKTLKSGQGWGLGHFTGYIIVPGMGEINFHDLGNTKIKGYDLKETWGVLMRYKTVEMYNRYEGEGHIILMLDKYGDLVTNARGSRQIISLQELKIDRSYPV